MFDFDVVTGPTQPPHCPIAEDSAASGAGSTRSESLPDKGKKPRS